MRALERIDYFGGPDDPRRFAARRDLRPLLHTGLALGVCAIALLVLRSQPAAAALLFEAELPASPFFVPTHFWLLYLAGPIAVLSGVTLLLAPGCLLVASSGQARGTEELLLKGFVASAALHFTATTLWKTFLGPLPANVFVSWVLIASALAWGVALRSGTERTDTTPKPVRPILGQRLVLPGLLALLPLLLLAPLFYWQDLTGDGAEMLYMAQSLETFSIPRFTEPLSAVTLGSGMLFQPIAASWLTGLFGTNPAAVRFLMVLFLPLVFAAVVLLVEYASPRRLTKGELMAVAVGLLVFAVTLGLNASYNPYATDLASPAGAAFPTILMMLATIYFWWTKQWGWFLSVVGLGFMCRPTELVLLIALGFVGAVFNRSNRAALLAVAAGILVGVGLHLVLGVLPGGTSATAPRSPLLRYEYIRLWDPRQLAMVVVGAGIVPVAALGLLRRWDLDTRALVGVWVLTLAAVYVPAQYAMHHLAFSMVLLMAVFWRTVLHCRHPFWVPVSITGAALTLVLALPQGAPLTRVYSQLGRTIYQTVGDVGGTFEERRVAVRAARNLQELFPGQEGREDSEFRGNWLALAYYATNERTAQTNYELRSPADGSEGELLTRDEFASVYVLDRAQWEDDRFGSFPTTFRSPVFAVPRTRMFHFVGGPAGDYDVYLGSVPYLWRLTSQ